MDVACQSGSIVWLFSSTKLSAMTTDSSRTLSGPVFAVGVCVYVYCPGNKFNRLSYMAIILRYAESSVKVVTQKK